MKTFTKIRIGVITLMIAVIIAGIGISSAHSATEANKAWWRNLSQGARNQAIVDRAAQDIGKYVGLNCKKWVQQVVPAASRGVVNIPLTLPEADGWYWDYSPYVVGMSGGIRAVQPGWIIQMNWLLSKGWTPHTAIVVGKTSTGVYLVESNWCDPPCYKVGLRWVSFTDFDAKAFRYTVYYITGG
ncbi:hypothetical protein EPN15_01445 [Patescibacteria group bacterium]|nr:MAG: hypothetical protein EPN15_01445 [Patescibacteria group bacterium]